MNSNQCRCGRSFSRWRARDARKPYEWGNLLGAKLLFLAAFVFAPIFVVECLLLTSAGFHPMALLPALGLHLAGLGWILVLPLFAIATVTSTVARSTLTVLGVLLVIVLSLLSLQNALSSGGYGFDVPGSGWCAVAFAVVAGSAIVLQFARRQLWKARLLMIGALVLLIAGGYLSGSSLLLGMVYRPAPGALQFALNPAGESHAQQFGPGNYLGISVPIAVSGIAAKGGVAVEGAQVVLEGSDGRRASTAWQSQGVYLVDADPDPSANLYFRLKRSFAEREAGKPLTLRLRLAVAELRANQPVQTAIADHEFAIAGFGICAPAEFSASSQFSRLSCRAALQEPMKTLIHVQWSDSPCSAHTDADVVVSGEGWAGTLQPGNELGLNPVVHAGFDLSNGFKMAGERFAGLRFLCPGTPITFTPYRLVRRAEYDATFANFIMPK